jgi:hypothetical protein
VAFEALWTMMADPELAGREYRVGTRLVARQSSVPVRERDRKRIR